jgi:hypothetical protein
MSRNGKRRKWRAVDEMRIVLAGMQPGVEVSHLCLIERPNPVLHYAWKKQLLGSASRIFEDRKARPDVRQERLEAENARFMGVIAEITVESLEIGKGLSG